MVKGSAKTIHNFRGPPRKKGLDTNLSFSIIYIKKFLSIIQPVISAKENYSAVGKQFLNGKMSIDDGVTSKSVNFDQFWTKLGVQSLRGNIYGWL